MSDKNVTTIHGWLEDNLFNESAADSRSVVIVPA